ncbi:MscS Mechanosensitive ion channel [Halorubrum californiense DSM 19288]|uniref:MscS Mechanosensitive ion channel n=1 Tax=Halorubrum californiense DSM 19288 TaxID=1227465 RepID=M0EBJ6_9EURY|nr:MULTISPECIES: mechanosensitive ion channel family protein [Halorubrum]ELZ44408.1 MscS Mechanosensitive ion channel [Halorubrum californiense DSM 19288]TKX71952.1 mechanosensitive ion channel family protein [Halorubrum sp. GN11GM_10-3_MGM]
MRRPLGLASIAIGLLAGVAGTVATTTDALANWPPIGGYPASTVVGRTLLVVAVAGLVYGTYFLAIRVLTRSANKRRAHNVRNLLRLAFVIVGTVATLAVATENWLGLLFSLGVIGFAITFALQQPLLSLIAWVYIAVKQPFGVGDRVKIDDAKGDVIGVDVLVTTLWEINGDLVTTNQPSGRVVTVPNSVVLSSNVVNFVGGGSAYVWNEVSVQVAYETDPEFARSVMIEEATDLIGRDMAEGIAAYREALAETPVELAVHDGPSVNVRQEESWGELRVRYLTHPRRGQRVKNRLYERILERFNDNPDRVAFPVSRSR